MKNSAQEIARLSELIRNLRESLDGAELDNNGLVSQLREYRRALKWIATRDLPSESDYPRDYQDMFAACVLAAREALK